MANPRALVIRAPGSNCDEETADAWSRAGATVETWHINRILRGPEQLDHFQILTIPGGFSYGDDLGAGRILATRLAKTLGEPMRRFRDRGGLILGICNGFQVLVQSGLLPDGASPCRATLAHNVSGRFESRWVKLVPHAGRSPFITFSEPIELPVAHGEGQFLATDSQSLESLERNGQIPLAYADAESQPTEDYPANPNGSARGIAGICDGTGRVFGLMPHPERYVEFWQHPRWTRCQSTQPSEGDGMRIFRSAVKSLRE